MDRDPLLIRTQFPLLGLVLATYVLVVLRTAWLCDDAYITFRTVDNFVRGYGLTWNVNERVQAYTHPLWMFLVSACYFFTREIFFTSILLSGVVSLLVVLVLVLRLAPSLSASIAGVAFLCSSKAFVDYSTSGLENPLTHLLLGVFVWLYLKKTLTPKTLFLLSLIAGLAAFNRMDTILLFLPAMICALWQKPHPRSLVMVVLGFLPFVVWELFSLFYYGFLFPNTAYAKLDSGIPASLLAKQGCNYLLNSLQLDPLTSVTIALACIWTLLRRQWPRLPLVLG